MTHTVRSHQIPQLLAFGSQKRTEAFGPVVKDLEGGLLIILAVINPVSGKQNHLTALFLYKISKLVFTRCESLRVYIHTNTHGAIEHLIVPVFDFDCAKSITFLAPKLVIEVQMGLLRVEDVLSLSVTHCCRIE